MPEHNPEVVVGKVLQVWFQQTNQPETGVFKVMTEQEASNKFLSDAWLNGGVSIVYTDDEYQLLMHRHIHRTGQLEAWYITAHPAF